MNPENTKITPSQIKPGDIFKKWKVIKYNGKDNGGNKMFLCECMVCGLQRPVRGSKLTSGSITACSKVCANTQIGERFGRWTVIGIDKSKPRNRICKCDCGTVRSVDSSTLKNGASKSCGCLKREMLQSEEFSAILVKAQSENRKKYLANAQSHIGERYGLLTIEEPILNEKRKQYFYRCRCDCGGETTTTLKKLIEGNTSSCGCIKSKANLQMSQILRKYEVPFKAEYRFDDCRDKLPLPFDFAVFNQCDELIGLIENNGIQHYSARGTGWNTPEHTIQVQKHDYIKQKFAEDNNIPFLIIPYQYFKEIEKFLITSDFWQIINMKLQRLSAPFLETVGEYKIT